MSLGDAGLMQGRYEDAIGFYQDALPIQRRHGDRLGESGALLGYGSALAGAGSEEAAAAVLEDAARIYELLGRDDAAATARERLAGLTGAGA